MTECTHPDGHGPDFYWVHDEKKEYCCRCRQHVPPPPVVPKTGFRSYGMRREGPTFGFHTDYSGYQVDGGYKNCGADQT